LGEITIPSILSRGVDFLHEVICLRNDEGLAELDDLTSKHLDIDRFQILGMVLSRGSGNAWTRQLPSADLSIYAPFYDEVPSLDGMDNIQMWRNLEMLQVRHQLQPLLGVFGMPSPEVVEGRMDLWSAFLWDLSRWPQISESVKLHAWDTQWNDLSIPPNYMETGSSIVRDGSAALQWGLLYAGEDMRG
jgi:hypothetical protein